MLLLSADFSHTGSAASILSCSLYCLASTSTSSAPSAVTLLYDLCCCNSAVRFLLLLTSVPLVDLLAYSLLHTFQI